MRIGDQEKVATADHGAVAEGGCWLDVARPVIARRMEGAGEIRFNLMAVTSDRASVCQRRLKELGPGGDPVQVRGGRGGGGVTERVRVRGGA